MILDSFVGVGNELSIATRIPQVQDKTSGFPIRASPDRTQTDAVAKLERNLIVERVKAGMCRARLEGRQVGRNPRELDRSASNIYTERGQTLHQIAKGHRISVATVWRVVQEQPAQTNDKAAGTERSRPVTKGVKFTTP